MESEITLTDWHAAPGGGVVVVGGVGSTKRRRVMMSHPAALWEAWWQQAAGKKHSVYACVCMNDVFCSEMSLEKHERRHHVLRLWVCFQQMCACVFNLQEHCKKEQFKKHLKVGCINGE